MYFENERKILTNLNGLSVLTALGGEVRFQGNTVLVSFAGLDNLTSVADNVVIVGKYSGKEEAKNQLSNINNKYKLNGRIITVNQ